MRVPPTRPVPPARWPGVAILARLGWPHLLSSVSSQKHPADLSQATSGSGTLALVYSCAFQARIRSASSSVQFASRSRKLRVPSGQRLHVVGLDHRDNLVHEPCDPPDVLERA